jgi:hypothetical protein
MIRASSKSGMKIGKAEDGNQEFRSQEAGADTGKFSQAPEWTIENLLAGIQDLQWGICGVQNVCLKPADTPKA